MDNKSSLMQVFGELTTRSFTNPGPSSEALNDALASPLQTLRDAPVSLASIVGQYRLELAATGNPKTASGLWSAMVGSRAGVYQKQIADMASAVAQAREVVSKTLADARAQGGLDGRIAEIEREMAVGNSQLGLAFEIARGCIDQKGGAAVSLPGWRGDADPAFISGSPLAQQI